MKIDWDVVDQIINSVAFYTDRYDRYTLYAEYQKAKKCLEFYPVNSTEFRSCLRVWYRNLTKERDTPPVDRIIQYIQDESNYFEDLKAVSPCARMAGNLYDGLEYFLADTSRHVVSIYDGRWEVSKESQYKFLSTKAFDEQVIPKKSDKSLLALLTPIVNLHGDDLALFAIWLTHAFCCGTRYGVMLSAERGSGKSSLTRTISSLVDPSEVDTTILQTKLEDLQNYLANHCLACFDNVREIPTEYSDTLCAAITGTTVAKRQLFKDREEVRLKLQNVVVMNGIGIFPKESDLAERFLYFQLQKIRPEEAKSDHELKQIFDRDRPLILGAICDLLAKATTLIKSLEPKRPTRLVDAYTSMLAIALAMGMSETEFHRLITQNIAQLDASCKGTPIVRAIREYMDGPKAGKRKVIQPSTSFFNSVKANYTGQHSDLPGRSAEFSKAIKAECSNLLKAGFWCLVDDTGVEGSVITVVRSKK